MDDENLFLQSTYSYSQTKFILPWSTVFYALFLPKNVSTLISQ